MTFATLYRHYDKDGILLYVGCSGNPLLRTMKHASQTIWFGQIDQIKLQHFNSIEKARDAEKVAILTENPKYNINGKFDKKIDCFREQRKIELRRYKSEGLEKIRQLIHSFASLEEAAKTMDYSIHGLIDFLKVDELKVSRYAIARGLELVNLYGKNK